MTSVLDAASAVASPLSPAEPLVVRRVGKSFDGPPVLSATSLHVDAGKIVALLGPSGCGKTTLLRIIAGLERPDAGEVRLGERVLAAPRTFVAPERRRIGMVFQDWALFPHLTVSRNVGFGLTRAERRGGRTEAALELVDLIGLADRMPATLSGGQQQRVALARALANRPAVLLLDEPFSNLDASLRGSIRGDVERLLRELSLTTVFVTHDQEEAFLLGDEVAIMLDGTVAQQDAPAEIYNHPATSRVAAFVGDANFIPGLASGGKAETPLGPVPLRDLGEGPVDVIVRPEQLLVEEGDVASVRAVEYYGHDAVSVLELMGGHQVRVRVLSAPDHRPGDRVSVRYVGGPTVAFPSR